MKVSKRDNILLALVSIVIGVLFIIYKGGILGIMMTILGIILIVEGILHLLNDKDKALGIILLVLGIVIICAGWWITSIVLYILAILLIIYGLIGLFNGSKKNIFSILGPILMIVAGLALLFNQKLSLDWFFIVEGVILIIEGLLNLFASTNK